MTAMRISLVLLMLLFLSAVTAFPPMAGIGEAEAGGKNTLNFDNKSGQDVLVRVFDKNSDKRLAEVKVLTGQTRGTSIADGDYYIVARYAGEPGKDGKVTHSYSKGDPFEIKPPAGKRSTVTITLHKVVNGNYSSAPTDERAFEK